MPEFRFDALRRFPDVEAPNLFAVDASDRLILDEAAADIEAAEEGEVVVIGDHYGALALGAIAVHRASGVRVHQDPLSGERALARNAEAVGLTDRYASHALGVELLVGARVVLMQLPRSLAELDEIADAIARFADPAVVVYAGGRLKHMTITMNEVLDRSFGEVKASLGRQKSRVLVARAPRRSAVDTPLKYPMREFHDDLGLWVAAHGAAFAGTRVDIGTRFLLGFLEEMAPDATRAIDLGCGTGILATALARQRPELTVVATDDSSAAVASAKETARANDVRLQVVRDDGLAQQEPASADLILLNPPFHVGSTVHAGIALKLFAEAARVLVPGGELWTVSNSHLSYRSSLTRAIGRTRQVARNDKFTVTVSSL